MKDLGGIATVRVGNGAEKRSVPDPYWQVAGDRVLLYLRCLNFPAPQALRLTLRALKAAEQNLRAGSGNNHPVSEAMEALHQLLAEQKPEIPGAYHYLSAWCDCAEPPTPPIHRRSMVPEGMDSAHWRSLLTHMFDRFR